MRAHTPGLKAGKPATKLSFGAIIRSAPATKTLNSAGPGSLPSSSRARVYGRVTRRRYFGVSSATLMNGFPTSAELDALRLSLEVAARSVGFSLPLAVLAAWLLTRARFPGRPLLDAFVHLPLVLPPVAVGYVLLLLFGAHGPIGGWLRGTLGIELAFTTAGAALATAVMTFPLMVRAIRIALENVDRGLEEAARTLGAGPLDRFVTITLPLVLPGILAGAVTAFAAGLGEFGAVITFASNVPGVTRTLPLALYTAIQSPGGDALALRLAVLSFVLGLAGLLAAELLARRVRRLLGR